MNYILCRNRVRNFDQWKGVFDSHTEAHRAAGLKLVHLWYELDSPRNIFFLFEAEDMERARAFLDSSEAAASAHQSGLIEGDFRFLSQSLGYGQLGEAESRALAEATERVAANLETNHPAPAEPAEAVTSSMPSEPEKSPDSQGTSEPSDSSQLEAEKNVDAGKTLSEPIKSADPMKSAMPRATMKGPERVKSTPPPAPVGGWEPVEHWPPAEAAAEAHEPAQHRRPWVRTRY
jgi:hypothetical protein